MDASRSETASSQRGWPSADCLPVGLDEADLAIAFEARQLQVGNVASDLPARLTRNPSGLTISRHIRCHAQARPALSLRLKPCARLCVVGHAIVRCDFGGLGHWLDRSSAASIIGGVSRFECGHCRAGAA
jgi:hypothetical protein